MSRKESWEVKRSQCLGTTFRLLYPLCLEMSSTRFLLCESTDVVHDLASWRVVIILYFFERLLSATQLCDFGRSLKSLQLSVFSIFHSSKCAQLSTKHPNTHHPSHMLKWFLWEGKPVWVSLSCCGLRLLMFRWLGPILFLSSITVGWATECDAD